MNNDIKNKQDKNPIISQEDYIKDSNQCPFCKSRNIESNGKIQFDFDETRAYYEFWCNDCEIIWESTYKFIGFVKSNRLNHS